VVVGATVWYSVSALHVVRGEQDRLSVTAVFLKWLLSQPQTLLVVAVAATWICWPVPSQLSTLLRMLSEVRVAGVEMYVVPMVGVVTALHSRFDVAVGAVVWYVTPRVQEVNEVSTLSEVSVAGVET